MIPQTSDELRAYFRRVLSIYPELFNTAHAICGNYDLAEYALRSAILEVWSQNANGGMGFREKLRNALRHEACYEALSPNANAAEFTWEGLQNVPQGDPVMKLVAQESVETRRLLMLLFGCGLSIRRCARLTQTTPGQARTLIDRFVARSRRKVSAQNRRRFDALLSRGIRQALVGEATNIPDPSTIYRAFEIEAAETQVSSHRLSRILCQVLMLVLAILCAGVFWLFAVIVEPPEVQAPVPAPIETESGITGDFPA